VEITRLKGVVVSPLCFRLESQADMCVANTDVRFTPNSDRKNGLSQKVVSALRLKADMCGANRHVCFGPKADLKLLFLARSFCRPIRIHSLELLRSRRDIITFTLSVRALRKGQVRDSIAKVLRSFLCRRCFAGVLPG